MTYRLLYFVTLTLPNDKTRPPKQLKRKLVAVIQSYRLKFGNLRYISVMSGSSQRDFHFHLLVDQPIPVEWLRRQWHRRTGGQQVSVKPFPDQDANRLARYMIVNYLQGHSRHHGKRLTYSRGLPIRLYNTRRGTKAWDFLRSTSTSLVAARHGQITVDGEPLPFNPETVCIPPPSMFNGASAPAGVAAAALPLRSSIADFRGGDMGWWSIKNVKMSTKDRGSKEDGGGGQLLNAIPGEDKPNDLYNGDEPADVMDECIEHIVQIYRQAWNRPPTKRELRAVFSFSSGVLDLKP